MSDSTVSTPEEVLPKLFTPNMILVSTLIGGPLSGCALIWANYKALGNHANAVKTIYWCLGGFIALFIITMFLPKNLSLTGMGVMLAIGLQSFARGAFGTGKPKASWWLSLLIGVLGLVVVVVGLFIVFSLSLFLFKRII